MRIGIASSFATGAGVWKRLADEGNAVRVWRGTEKDGSPALLASHRRVGEGIVPLCDSWHELVSWVSEAPGTSMLLFDSSGLGKFADDARKRGLHVIGGGTFCDKLEKKRAFGREIATAAGIDIPGFLEFPSIEACLAFAKSGKLDRAVYFKSDAYITGDATHKCETPEELAEWLPWVRKLAGRDVSCILEEKLDGFALSTGRYWNGRAWVGPYEWTLERKAHMPGDIGPSTGCALNAVGFYEDDSPQIAAALNWDALTESWLANEAPPGLYDLNAIIQDGEAYFLEHTSRFGWDSEGTSHLLFDDFGAWLWQVATGQGSAEPTRDEFAMAVRLSVAPAPWEYGERDEKGSPVGLPVRGDVGDLWSGGFVGYELMDTPEDGLSVAAPEGLVGLSAAVGEKASDLAEEILSFAGECLRVPGLQYRNDVGEAIAEDAQKCVDEGFTDLPASLLE